MVDQQAAATAAYATPAHGSRNVNGLPAPGGGRGAGKSGSGIEIKTISFRVFWLT
jgi:hypothetical protein